jgi:hypothetical protein
MVAPDVEQLAQMKLQNLLPNSKNPGALTTGILGQILGKKGQTDAGQNGAAPQNPLGQIMGAIGGKKQPSPTPQQPGAATSQPSPTPQPKNPVGDILNRVLGGKGGAQPTPTPRK